MTERTVPYITGDLRTAIEQRRTERRLRQQADEERARQLALQKAEAQRAEWITALRADNNALRIIALLGLVPEDIRIDREYFRLYLRGQALIADGVRFTVAIIQSPTGAAYHYANVTCAADGYEREYRGITIPELSDRILDAAEQALDWLNTTKQADAIWGNGG